MRQGELRLSFLLLERSIMKTVDKFVGFDALKQSVSMAEILDRYGLLERLHRNGDSLNGVCPIHAGHNPAQFRVSLSKNCWICFGDCHTGGSIVDLVSRKERIGIRDDNHLIQDWIKVQINQRDGHRLIDETPLKHIWGHHTDKHI